ncbi:MAG: hypothetical protein J5594_05550 [Elusimicrobiaceae bacterium]|nr:hypothetical protein [Elusimicrobiaceae bacterium]
MKKKNLAVTLAVIAVSAIPLMAQELAYNIDKELSKEITTIIQQDIQVPHKQQQQPKNNANKAIEALRNLLNDESLTTRVKKQTDRNKRYEAERSVCQDVFTTLDNLASAILSLPEGQAKGKMANVIKVLKENKFKYLDKSVTLQELFDFSISLGVVSYTDNSPIVQLLNTNYGCERYHFVPTLVLAIDSGKPIEYFETMIDNICPDVTVYESELKGIRHYADYKGRTDIVEFLKDKDYLVNTEWEFVRNDSITVIQDDGTKVRYKDGEQPSKKNSSTTKPSWLQGLIETFQHEK